MINVVIWLVDAFFAVLLFIFPAPKPKLWTSSELGKQRAENRQKDLNKDR